MLDKILKIWRTDKKLKWSEDSKIKKFCVMEFNYS